ncbi:Trifunctional nucleotide phosphoesterase protein YfkN [Psilocybe cubensis]|uniref:Trifunctional nucleotide phosphoesterase protein YfkN n=2 Tax=Psilocybe cubensis TaxID=181762 RepID=A0ACB8H8L8_PSICU|nr:Trifunctional nucleotide phosphoesterase protein YfkN [Psilocybe cubensis]KAH9484179.1 Trifunctional nucleotide phosphoesterase protein YfkN [Psilocybe cubensis]
MHLDFRRKSHSRSPPHRMASDITLPILHFNDVYRVTPQKISRTESIDVTQFAALVDDIRNNWPNRPDGKKDGLLLFSGDVFSPSVESSVTRGSHMVPVMNQLGVDVSVTGNHDFDFGYPHLCKLVNDTNFPWILSNIIDTTTSKIPQQLNEYVVIERSGVRIGFIGLVEEDWITTVSAWPPEFVYTSMKETALALSKKLRDPQGEHRCDIIIALTHSRLPNDITLAKELFAFSPNAQKTHPIASEHGIDLLLGGHDHMYFVGKGVTSWDGYDLKEDVLGAESDEGDILVIKSGTDFRDLSEMAVTVSPTPPGSVRRMVISKITGKRHVTQPGYRSSKKMTKLLKNLLGSISSALKAPICRTDVMIDVRSYYIRVTESPICNWIADICRHAYDEALCQNGGRGSDGVFLCAGTFRGDSTYGPGVMTIGDILEILPFDDPTLVIEIDGATLWAALESALSTWPAQEGRFPAISGFRVTWDSRREPGHRVLGVWLLIPSNEAESNKEIDKSHYAEEPVKNEVGGRTYRIVSREYMVQGHDGFEALTKGKILVDHECGEMLSTIVRKYMLGSHFVNKVIRKKEEKISFLRKTTLPTIHELEKEFKLAKADRSTAATRLWKYAANLALHRGRSKSYYQTHIKISSTEHMSSVDAYDGESIRKGRECRKVSTEPDDDLLLVHPHVDGRLVNVGKGAEESK